MKTVMIDTGVILRALIGPNAGDQPQERVRFHQAAEVFRRVSRGQVQATMTDATIAEVVASLTSPRLAGLTREDAAGRMRALLAHSGVRISGRAAALSALDRWSLDPSLSFSEALTIERASETGAVLVADYMKDLPVINGN